MSRKSTRRSSILKLTRPVVSSDSNPSSAENSPTLSKIKRRVSFAEKKHVKEFLDSVEQGTVWDNTYEESETSDSKSSKQVDTLGEDLTTQLQEFQNQIDKENVYFEVDAGNAVENDTLESTVPVGEVNPSIDSFELESVVAALREKQQGFVICPDDSVDTQNFQSNLGLDQSSQTMEMTGMINSKGLQSTANKTVFDNSMELTTVLSKTIAVEESAPPKTFSKPLFAVSPEELDKISKRSLLFSQILELKKKADEKEDNEKSTKRRSVDEEEACLHQPECNDRESKVAHAAPCSFQPKCRKSLMKTPDSEELMEMTEACLHRAPWRSQSAPQIASKGACPPNQNLTSVEFKTISSLLRDQEPSSNVSMEMIEAWSKQMQNESTSQQKSQENLSIVTQPLGNNESMEMTEACVRGSSRRSLRSMNDKSCVEESHANLSAMEFTAAMPSVKNAQQSFLQTNPENFGGKAQEGSANVSTMEFTTAIPSVKNAQQSFLQTNPENFGGKAQEGSANVSTMEFTTAIPSVKNLSQTYCRADNSCSMEMTEACIGQSSRRSIPSLNKTGNLDQENQNVSMEFTTAIASLPISQESDQDPAKRQSLNEGYQTLSTEIQTAISTIKKVQKHIYEAEMTDSNRREETVLTRSHSEKTQDLSCMEFTTALPSLRTLQHTPGQVNFDQNQTLTEGNQNVTMEFTAAVNTFPAASKNSHQTDDKSIRVSGCNESMEMTEACIKILPRRSLHQTNSSGQGSQNTLQDCSYTELRDSQNFSHAQRSDEPPTTLVPKFFETDLTGVIPDNRVSNLITNVSEATFTQTSLVSIPLPDCSVTDQFTQDIPNLTSFGKDSGVIPDNCVSNLTTNVSKATIAQASLISIPLPDCSETDQFTRDIPNYTTFGEDSQSFNSVGAEKTRAEPDVQEFATETNRVEKDDGDQWQDIQAPWETDGGVCDFDESTKNSLSEVSEGAVCMGNVIGNSTTCAPVGDINGGSQVADDNTSCKNPTQNEKISRVEKYVLSTVTTATAQECKKPSESRKEFTLNETMSKEQLALLASYSKLIQKDKFAAEIKAQKNIEDLVTSVESVTVEEEIPETPLQKLVREMEEYQKNDPDCIFAIDDVNEQYLHVNFFSRSLLVGIYFTQKVQEDELHVPVIQDIIVRSILKDKVKGIGAVAHRLLLLKLDPDELLQSYRHVEDVFNLLEYVSNEVKLAMDIYFDLRKLDMTRVMDFSAEKVTFRANSPLMNTILNVHVKVKPLAEIKPHDVTIDCILGHTSEKDIKQLITCTRRDGKFFRSYMKDVNEYLKVLEEIKGTSAS